MKRKSFSDTLYDAVENYYQYNPDTLMPLMMVALAAKGALCITSNPSNKKQQFCTLNLDEAIKYDWVQLDPALRKRIKKELADNHHMICAEGSIEKPLLDVYETFHRYDTFTVDEEYHHRIGILYYHSSNRASEQAQRQYATLCLAEALADAPEKWVKDNYLYISNHMLVRSGLQPERPRLEVAQALCALLQYDGKGKVYNPFAGCSITAAMISAGNKMYADGNNNDKLFAVAKLLNYGTSGSYEHVVQRDSEKWIDKGKFDYVVSTYRGYIEGKSAFDFCLAHCFDTLTGIGRYAGIISPKDIFEKQSEAFKEALKRDWVDTIALLPFGEVAILINVAKTTELKKRIRFFDLTHPMLRRRPLGELLNDDDYAEILSVSDVKKKGYLRSLIVTELAEREGHTIVKLSDFICKIKKQTYDLIRRKEEEQALAFIKHNETYDQFDHPWMNNIGKRPITSLFAPAYHLTMDCLITNDRGKLEPRLFDACKGNAYFQNGYAFELTNPEETDFRWLIHELNEPYVTRQLHPYGMDEMVPETITEDQILNLSLYKEIEEEFEFDDLDFGETDFDPDADKLSTGYVLKGANTEYTIHEFLGHGFFGYTYSAQAHNLATGERKEVVLKEFYPFRYFRREGVRAVLIDEEEFVFMEDSRDKFMEEAEIMHKLGTIPDSHIVPAFELFRSEETQTEYYVMPFYHDGSLADLQNSGFTFTEDLVLKHVIKPLCKALHVAHKSKVLHLDIKPENILVDEKGDAVLIDFGVAKQYDTEGNVIDNRGAKSQSEFAAPELAHGNMVKFGSQTDIYGLASSVYYLLCAPEQPHPIFDFSDQDEDLRENMSDARCSEKFIDAIIAGLQFSATSRPANAQKFLNLFPGCENIKL